MYKIITKSPLNEYISQITLDAPMIARKVRAGQFVMLIPSERGERIPLTVADFDRSAGTVKIIYQKVGKSTMDLDRKNAGDFICDVAGPLGKPSKLSGYRRAVVIGGGTGCAIAYPQAKALSENGCRVDIVAGFRDRNLIIMEKEMNAVAENTDIATDDGSNGNKGLVTDVLYNKLRSGEKFDIALAVGPIPMMKAVCGVTKEFGLGTVVSMNAIMVDGTGMCGGCRVNVGGKVKFACIDGPDFDGHLVDFDSVSARCSEYRTEENKAREKYCRLMKGAENA